jgi:hypothetical protein
MPLPDLLAGRWADVSLSQNEFGFEKLIERMVKADLARLQGQPLPDFKARGI